MNTTTAAALVAAATALAALTGCGGGAEPAGRPVSTIPSKPLLKGSEAGAADSAGQDNRQALGQYASDLQAMFEQLRTSPAPQASAEPAADVPAPTRTTARSPEPESEPVAAVEVESVAAAEPVTEPAPEVAQEPETIEDLMGRLAAMLAAEGDGARPPLGRALRLAVLEAVQPGAGAAETDAIERTLLPAEAAALRAVRAMMVRLGELGSSGADAASGPMGVADAVEECSRQLEAERPLTIPTAVLCERVESFGRYTPFAPARFAAGREHAAILYVEVEHFAQRGGDGTGASGAGEWTTELAQAVDLYHDADGSLQWRRPEQVVRDSARRRRSDYYLVQRITLPATLSVGRYNLKVTVTDRISGRTAQARVPVEIVADPALVQKPSR
jgi:hypothetical protein